jgi:alpha-tubulin suppressor-like RCC1 family protein
VTAAATLAAGYVHTCALLDDGSGQCWGYNTDGEFGDGTKTTSATPVRVVW